MTQNQPPKSIFVSWHASCRHAALRLAGKILARGADNQGADDRGGICRRIGDPALVDEGYKLLVMRKLLPDRRSCVRLFAGLVIWRWEMGYKLLVVGGVICRIGDPAGIIGVRFICRIGDLALGDGL